MTSAGSLRHTDSRRDAAGASRFSAALAGLTMSAALVGCQPAPPPTAVKIEQVAMRVAQQGDLGAERRLLEWARGDNATARRELGLIYLARPARRAEALPLFKQAAHAGDVEAAFRLGEMYRLGMAGLAAAPERALPWYRIAAQHRHAKAALVLGMLFKNGDGVERDAAQAAKWLTLSSEQGNAHAMFLLSYAYRDGTGVRRDGARSRALLEQAAEHDYPPAIQELAMTLQVGDALSAKDEVRAGHLMKEATEHRHNNWNRF